MMAKGFEDIGDEAGVVEAAGLREAQEVGCGVCARACPTEALQMQRKPEEEIEPIPKDSADLFNQMGWREP